MYELLHKQGRKNYLHVGLNIVMFPFTNQTLLFSYTTNI